MEPKKEPADESLVINYLNVDRLDDHCQEGRMFEPIVFIFDFPLSE